jgi:hypothetical protein
VLDPPRFGAGVTGVDRVIGTVLLFLFGALVLPTVAELAQATIPLLISVLILLFGLRLLRGPHP